MLDRNRLKETNDTYGHRMGDELVRRVAGAIKSVLPAGAMAARMGGDEFLVV